MKLGQGSQSGNKSWRIISDAAVVLFNLNPLFYHSAQDLNFQETEICLAWDINV